MAGRCETCGGRIPIKPGRRPRYCCSPCRQRAYRARRANRYPEEMTSSPRWTAADGKRPVTPTGAAASSTDPATWCGYEQVRHGAHGFMCGGGFACIDLDGCLDSRGRLRSWARPILDAVPGAFIEYSCSGRGVHVFGLAPEAPGMRRGGAEFYSTDRFIRVTGRVYRRGGMVSLLPAKKLISSLPEGVMTRR